MSLFEEALAIAKEGAEKAGTDILTFMQSVAVNEEMRKVRQQQEVQIKKAVHTARTEAEPKLAEFYKVNSDFLSKGRFDPHELTGRVGLEDTQGNRMWLSRKLLEYRKADELRREGAEQCQAEAA